MSEGTVLTKNQFECLKDESENRMNECVHEEKKVIVIGDSNVRRLEIPIVSSMKAKKNLKHLLLTRRSGARIGECEERLKTALKDECKA